MGRERCARAGRRGRRLCVSSNGLRHIYTVADSSLFSDDANSSLMLKAAQLSARRKERLRTTAAAKATAPPIDEAKLAAEREERRRRQVAEMLGELGATPPVSKPSREDSKRRVESREKDRSKDAEREKERKGRRDQPRPSTESLVVDARPSKSGLAAESTKEPRHRVRSPQDSSERRHERDSERRSRAHQRAASPRRAEPTPAASSSEAIPSKPVTSSAALVASILASLDDTPPPPPVLTSKSPNKGRRPASPATGRASTKDKAVSRKEGSKPSAVPSGRAQLPASQLRTLTKENAVLKAGDTAAAKKRVVSSSSTADLLSRRADGAPRERVRA